MHGSLEKGARIADQDSVIVNTNVKQVNSKSRHFRIEYSLHLGLYLPVDMYLQLPPRILLNKNAFRVE